MATTSHAHATDRPGWPGDAAGTALGALRSAVGLGSWLSPGGSWRTFGLASIQGDPRAGLVTRLFGVRDLALGLAVRHPDPAVRRAALRLGVAVDAADVAASLLALRRGAPRASLVLVGGGAALFIGLGVAALADSRAVAR